MSNELNLRPFASFRGLRNVPMVALSHNSIRPHLSLTSEGIDFRVIRKHFLTYRDLEAVTYGWALSHQITLIPKHGPWTYAFNYFRKEQPMMLLTQLQQQGVSLTPLALNFLVKDKA